jgi:hypothetical protein
MLREQLNNLRSRTGVETMLFTTRGTTDMPMRGVSFTTSGVENFLEGVMKTDTQDFLGEMEGFAVQGIQGKQMTDNFVCCFDSYIYGNRCCQKS